jgi:D-tyrosyl-tRNA(Tyr) deacylase
MRAVVQRVSQASVTVDAEVVGSINNGLCVLIGVARDDVEADALKLAKKVCRLRVFNDPEDKMNLSLLDVGGRLLAVSQFTLLGDARRGHRPSFADAMAPERANQLFQLFCQAVRDQGTAVETGRFRTSMQVSLVNQGPVTILLDSKRLF